jgi:hypothetical protein
VTAIRSAFQLRASARRVLIFTGVLTALAFSLAGPAGAVVTTVNTGSGNTVVGLQPRNSSSFVDGDSAAAPTFANPAGHPVVHSSQTFAVYWDPTDHYHGDWQGIIDTFLHGVGAESGSTANVFAVDGQYRDATDQGAAYRATFRGAYTDTDQYPSGACTDPQPLAEGQAITCLTDQQIREELAGFIASHDLPKGMGTIFYLLTPPGVAVCLDAGSSASHCSDDAASANSFCSYHGAITPTNPATGDANTILYAAIPWSAGGAGDYHLAPVDRKQAPACQDGGFDASSTEPIEKREAPKEKTAAEEAEFSKETLEEKAQQLDREELEGPHDEEPNQLTHTGPDGTNDTGLADLIVNQIAVEQQNVVTDPLLNAWQDSAHNEATDECRNFFAADEVPGSVTASKFTRGGSLSNQRIGELPYYLNMAFNLAAVDLSYPGVRCVPGVILEPKFTTPNTVNVGETVGFNGMESDITLNAAAGFSSGTSQTTYARYVWNFGDGTPTVTGNAPGAPSLNSPASAPCETPWLTPCAAATFHSYQYGGVYNVTLTVTDVAGNTASVTNPVNVVGPPPPVSAAPGEGTGSGESAGTTASGTAASGSPGSTPGPVARAAAVSGSLRKALKQGLPVSYSVNEQVAGRFEVLLNSQTARSLGIKGRTATGLPVGSKPSLVIAEAILVTTKGGHSTIHIKFSKRTAARLHRLHKVTLGLRLQVRDAAAQNPQSTTVMTTVLLHG